MACKMFLASTWAMPYDLLHPWFLLGLFLCLTISLWKDLWAHLELNNAFPKDRDTVSPWGTKDMRF